MSDVGNNTSLSATITSTTTGLSAFVSTVRRQSPVDSPPPEVPPRHSHNRSLIIIDQRFKPWEAITELKSAVNTKHPVATCLYNMSCTGETNRKRCYHVQHIILWSHHASYYPCTTCCMPGSSNILLISDTYIRHKENACDKCRRPWLAPVS